MKKYVQITLVLGSFFLLVFFRNLNISDPQPILNAPKIATPTSNKLDTIQPQQATPITSTAQGQYKDGIYMGIVADAYYGNIQVQSVITGGKITDVIFLQHPSDNRTSESINSQAMPLLKQEALQKQSASVDGVSGASDSSQAFQQSLASALAQAK